MATPQIIPKRVAIDKANARMVIFVAAASFITIFCLIATKAIWSQYSYLSRVTAAKTKAHKQLVANLSAYKDLSGSYNSFVSSSVNVLGGSSSGSGDSDGDNARIVLNALPPSYDFPALTSSIEKLLTSQSTKITSIGGTDDQANQQNNSSSGMPQPVPIPFTFAVQDATYQSVQQLFKSLQHSIRPIQIDNVTVSGSMSNLSATVTAHTYYQPATSLTITKQVVK